MVQNAQQKTPGQEPHPLVRIATLEAKVAQLEQRLANLENKQNLSPVSEKQGENAQQGDRLFEIVKINAKIVESNDSWSKFAWKLDLKSFSNEPLVFNVTIDFLDEEGFILDDANEYNLVLPSMGEKSYTGYKLVDEQLVNRVASIQARVNP